MKLLFDQNISHKILASLPEQFSGSTTVKKEGLINAFDLHIWDYAKNNNFIIVTQDSDFNDLNTLKGFPPKIIWIRTGNLSTKALLDILIDNYSELVQFESDNEHGCFEIIKLQ
jgi:predicted nuclease of predicted toxin-antitoxin system